MLLGILALVLATGCTPSLPADAPTTVPSDGTAWVDPLQPDDQPEFRTVPTEPAVMLTASQAWWKLSLPWHLISISDDHRTIDIVYVAGDGDCIAPVGLRVTRRGGDVRVAALSQHKHGQEACADMVVIKRTTIQLPVAITGDVRLVHATVGRAWATDADWKQRHP